MKKNKSKQLAARNIFRVLWTERTGIYPNTTKLAPLYILRACNSWTLEDVRLARIERSNGENL